MKLTIATILLTLHTTVLALAVPALPTGTIISPVKCALVCRVDADTSIFRCGCWPPVKILPDETIVTGGPGPVIPDDGDIPAEPTDDGGLVAG